MTTRNGTPLLSLSGITISSLALVLMLGCSNNSDNSSGTVNDVSFAVSDAPVGNLRSVTITIESLEVNRDGDRTTIETFDTEAGEVERVTVDLLDYQGSDSMLIVDSIELEVGTYEDLRLAIIDEDTDASFVLEEGDDTRKVLKVPSNELKLGGFEVTSGGPQTFIIEFGLPRAMTYNPGPDRYILKPRGVRVIEVEAAATIAGTATSELLDACDLETEGHGNRVYVYQNHGLSTDDLSDSFDRDVDDTAPAVAVEPFATEALDAEGRYEIAFIPAGDYTVAFACDVAADEAELYDGIVIPSPTGQVVEVTLDPGDETTCDFELAGPSCS